MVKNKPSIVVTCLLSLIRIYRYLSWGQSCRFYPCCSSYALQALQTYGALKGSWLIIKRLARCHPWHDGGLDELPCKHSRG